MDVALEDKSKSLYNLIVDKAVKLDKEELFDQLMKTQVEKKHLYK